MARVIIYRNYKLLVDKDPVIEALRIVIKSEEKLKNSQAHSITGIATQTFDSWFDGTTRKPQNATVSQAVAALGYAHDYFFDDNGNLVPHFTKKLKIDRQKAIEAQAVFFLKNHPAKKKKKKKRKTTNGHAK